MTHRLLTAVSRALTPRPAGNTDTHVHFHQGAHGTPAACFDGGCDRPRLSVR